MNKSYWQIVSIKDVHGIQKKKIKLFNQNAGNPFRSMSTFKKSKFAIHMSTYYRQKWVSYILSESIWKKKQSQSYKYRYVKMQVN